MTSTSDEVRCPVCGRGVVADIAFDAAAAPQPDLRQTAESRELVTFTCGHEVPGPSLRTSDAEILDVERRSSAEVAEPRPRRGDGA